MNQMIKPEIGNLQSFCRTCLGQLSLNPEGTKYHIHYTPNLVKLLTLSTNLNLKDAEKEEVFPQCVCSKCHWSLQEFQRFRTMAQDTATMLQDIVDAGTVAVKQASEIEDLEDEEDDEVEDEEEEEEALVGITDSFSLNCDTTQESQNSMLDTGAEIKIEAMFTDEPQANLSYNATSNTYGNYDAAAYISNDAKRKRISDDYGSSSSNFNNRTESHSAFTITTIQGPHETTPVRRVSHPILNFDNRPLPTVECIKNLSQIVPIYRRFLNGNPLENKDRVKIAKAIIDECLKFNPQKGLSRSNFELLCEHIITIFPEEVESAYFIPSSKSAQARGKLWNAYNNKKCALREEGIIRRRARQPNTDSSAVLEFEHAHFTGEHDETQFSNTMSQFEKICSNDLTEFQKRDLESTLALAKGEDPTVPTVELMHTLPQIASIYRRYSKGYPLDNNDRVKIAKAIIDECVKNNPKRVLSRIQFLLIAENIRGIFPKEVDNTYYIPSTNGERARGKLWNAYNNKRTALSAEGVIQRRPKTTGRLCISPVVMELPVLESITYLEANDGSDWPTVLSKWTESHSYRRKELLTGLAIESYISKYPALQQPQAIELLTLDLKWVYPTMNNIEHWLQLYPKVLTRARTLRDAITAAIVSDIDFSLDEKYKAGLAFLLIPYILPHGGKRVGRKRASKKQIQEQFIIEYSSVDELNAATDRVDLQLAFVREDHQISIVEFQIAGTRYKSNDLLDGVNLAFIYMNGLALQYPNVCIQVWQFIQLGIYEIELSDSKVPCIESTVNDLFK